VSYGIAEYLCKEITAIDVPTVGNKINACTELNHTALKLDPQCKLPDAVAAGVTAAGALNLTECALTRQSRTLSQIVARVVQVYVIRDIGEAAFELQPHPFRELEVLGQPQRIESSEA
jgi:hypothetical protein